MSGLVFVAMAAKGDGCAPEPDPGEQTECSVPADCDKLAHIECVGAWSCETNACKWSCDVQPPTGCFSDNECPAGFECNSETVCLPPPGCKEGATCPAVCYGECVAKAPTTCTSSLDCGTGEHCSTDDGVCNMACAQPAPEAPSGATPSDARPCAPRCTGECVSNPSTNCYADSDCGNGQWCNTAGCGMTPTPDAAGARMACPGVCEDRPRCGSDEQCGAGERCDCVFPTPSAGGVVACDLRCVPATCSSNAECNAGETCVNGTCSATGPVECTTDKECPADNHCQSDCFAADASGASDAMIACPSHCVPNVQTCGDQGLVCNSNEVCQADCYAVQTDCDCADGAPCDCPWTEVCDAKCVPQTTNCTSDLECNPGYYCGCGPFATPAAGGMMICNLQCLPQPTTECTSDSECGGDSFCDFSVCNATGDPAFKVPCAADDPNCGVPAPPPCYGVCAPRPTTCTSDAECKSGDTCVYDVCAGSSGSSDMACWGHCESPIQKPYNCWTDADCGANGACAYDTSCGAFAPPPDGDMMPRPACGGWCEYHEPQCKADCDCAFGYGCTDGACQIQEAVGACADDGTCKDGYTCGCPARFMGPAAGVACFPQCYPSKPACCDNSQCGGGNICVAGSCETVACDANQKCPDGSHCENGCGMPTPAGGLIACPMICVPDAPKCASDCDCDASTACVGGSCQVVNRLNECNQGQCMSDADCVAGSYCKIGFYDPAMCSDPNMCDAIMPVGICVPQEPPSYCASDADCGPGGVCHSDAPCTCFPDAAGNMICPPCAAPRTWCEYPPKETLCDAAGACPAGFECNPCAHGSCPACDDCVAVCEPIVDLSCRGDADCASAEVCDLKACGGGACPPGMDCPVCVGQCVPAATENVCHPTGCSGQICSDKEIITTCEMLPWYMCYKLATCEGTAAQGCDWAQTPEFVKCMEQMGGFSGATPP